MTTEWRNARTDPPPTDGTPIWGFLFNSGIRKLRWQTAEEMAEEDPFETDPELFEAQFIEVNEPMECWSPAWWLPNDAIPEPPHDPR